MLQFSEFTRNDSATIAGDIKRSFYVPPHMEGNFADSGHLKVVTPEMANRLAQNLRESGIEVITHDELGNTPIVQFATAEAAHTFEKTYGADIQLDPQFKRIMSATPLEQDQITEYLSKGLYESCPDGNARVLFRDKTIRDNHTPAHRLTLALVGKSSYKAQLLFGNPGFYVEIIGDDSEKPRFEQEYGAYLNLGPEFAESKKNLQTARAKAHERQ